MTTTERKRSRFRLWGRWLGMGLAAPFFMAALWGLAGLAGALIPAPVAVQPGAATVEIGLIATPIHYDLLLPLTPDLRARFGFAAQAGVAVEAPEAGWLLVGWGAREFYTAGGGYGDLPLRAVAKGIAGDASVLRLEAWGRFALRDAPEVTRLRLTPAGYAALLARISAELGAPELVKAPGLTQADAFFAGRSGFSALRTCNVWMGEALRAAGVPLGRWTPTPQALRLSLWVWG